MENLYIYPLLDGPVIELKDINVFFKTNFDTMTISNSDGHFLLAHKIFAGEGGSLQWPKVHDKMEGAKIEFGKWHFETKYDFFWTPHVKLIYDKFSDKPIDGKFEFKSTAHKAGVGTGLSNLHFQ